jgi:hypothetical protein
MKVSESIKDFLTARATPTNQDLVDRWHLGMETQVNVRAGDGEPVTGKKATYSDGSSTWWNIRIPHGSDGEPEWNDYVMTWPLDVHYEGIGLTGWNWQERTSKWVAFDFDGISGHAAGVGISDEDLAKVREAASSLPYVEVRRSTGGAGIHIYVYLDAIPTANHTEHAALARCILGMLSAATGFDFASHIDACGSVMWILHRKMTAENHGLEIIKASTQILSITDLPSNWRDHIDVVSRKRSKLKVSGLKDGAEEPFETLASSRRGTPLDQQHKDTIDELTRSHYSTVWLPDHHCLQTHTKALEELSRVGVFKTLSEGKHPETPNCFAFPVENGAFRVYRFHQGASEAVTWEQDGAGWTNCYFNRQPDLNLAAKVTGGVEAPDNGGYVFPSIEEAAKAVEILGQSLVIPDELQGREARLKVQKDGRVSVNVKKGKDEIAPAGWVGERGQLRKLLNLKAELKAQIADDSYADYDKLIRTLNTPDHQTAGWRLKTDEGFWSNRPKDDVKSALLYHGKTKTEADVLIGAACTHPWKIVVIPFAPEYPGGREWNIAAAQYKCQPCEGEHPHWDMILKHCFGDLDESVRKHPWCQKNGIKTGAEYGLLWAANLLREPFKPLPYLFFWGDENCGKSTFQESFEFLMTKGRVAADRALKSQNDFNGELAGAILAYVEEIDISKTPGALNKIKDWSVAPILWVRQMRTDAYSVRNTLHFVQTANDPNYCPVFPGDTRVTMIYVPDLGDREIPREKFHERLVAEAPHYLHTLLNVTLPEPDGRFRIPIIETGGKARAQSRRLPVIEKFIAEHCYQITGQKIAFADFCNRFLAWLTPEDQQKWNKRKIEQQLPSPCGIIDGAKWVGNLSWENTSTNGSPWVSENGKLLQAAE